jgi:hypothetical protein
MAGNRHSGMGLGEVVSGDHGQIQRPFRDSSDCYRIEGRKRGLDKSFTISRQARLHQGQHNAMIWFHENNHGKQFAIKLAWFAIAYAYDIQIDRCRFLFRFGKWRVSLP